jgi:origin recognition complex subunit 5
VPACVVLASTIPWDELRPARADALEPINVYLPPLTREGTQPSGSRFHSVRRLSADAVVDTLRHLLPASDHPLWPRFLDLLLATLSSLLPSSPPIELAHLASALWPIYTSSLPPHIEQLSLARPYPDPSDPPPPLGITVKLLTDLKSSMAIPLAAAAESLIPRRTGAVQFTEALLPRPGDMAGMGLAKRSVPRPPPLEVPMVGKYLLVAAYCGSYNPAKTDLRLFGRAVGPDGKKKKGGGTRRAGYGRVRMGKVSNLLQSRLAVDR